MGQLPTGKGPLAHLHPRPGKNAETLTADQRRTQDAGNRMTMRVGPNPMRSSTAARTSNSITETMTKMMGRSRR